MERKGYMMIREAAAQYGVSRAKLHRLIKLGRLRTAKDPRDERVTLLRTEDVEELFRFPRHEGANMYYVASTENTEGAGKLTAELAARMDELRIRVAAGRRFSDSVDIIREEREKRTKQIEEAVSGTPESGE